MNERMILTNMIKKQIWVQIPGVKMKNNQEDIKAIDGEMIWIWNWNLESLVIALHGALKRTTSNPK